MRLDDNELRRLIEIILAALGNQKAEEDAESAKNEISVVFSAPWDNRFYSFADGLKSRKNCLLRAYVSPEMPENSADMLKKLADWESFEKWDGGKIPDLSGIISVFPVTWRDTAVKAALCISDTFETRWIRAAMEQGGKIVLPMSGFERFTGREPEKYRQKILSYQRQLLEMDIELPENFEKYRI